ncbi:MAG: molybdopterin molybdotransferase MoeA, partial [Candidatus Binatia bacterium]
ESVRSLRDVPGYANSAMDGYAVRGADLAGGPTRLRVVGVIPAGAALPLPEIRVGEAVKIMTGGAVPASADTVVRVEDTDAGSDVVEIRVPPKPGANIRQAAEDVAVGATVLERGRRLSPADVGLLASVGRTFVQVHRRPTVAIVSTGDELVEADEQVTPGRVVNSNAYALAAAVAEAGAVPVVLPIARDTPESIRAVFAAAARHDVILSTGGVSVGEFDYVKSVMDELGVKRLFWKVAQKPGKPLTFGTLGSSVLFGLPGNPVSSLVCFYLYARPALRRMAGHEAIHLAFASATLAEDLRKADGMTEFVRVRLEHRDGGLVARSTGTQSSGVLSS